MFLAMHVSWNPGSIIIEITLYRRRLLLLIMVPFAWRNLEESERKILFQMKKETDQAEFKDTRTGHGFNSPCLTLKRGRPVRTKASFLFNELIR